MPPAVTFTYNGLGDRMQQSYAGNTTTYLLDIASGLTQVLADGESTYLYGLGRIGEEGTAGWQYHHGDVLGSVRQLADPSGAITLAKNYEPYGDLLSSAGDVDTPYDFTGEWRDNTGLIYLRARYYESTVGRFISRDSWEGDFFKPMSYNLWAYAYANPLRYTDPNGEFVLVPVVIGGVIGGAGYVISHPGQSIGEYARSGAFWRAAGAGAVGGLVSGLIPFGGAGLASAIGYGVMGGMASGVTEQLIYNLLTPCNEWNDHLLEAALVGGAAGGVFGGIGYGVRGFLGKAILQKYTNISNVKLSRDPAFAEEILSKAQYTSGQNYTRVFPMQYGNAIEKLVKSKVESTWWLGILYKHIGGPGKPDFVGRSIFSGMSFDITTDTIRSITEHKARSYGRFLTMITYQRLPNIRLFP